MFFSVNNLCKDFHNNRILDNLSFSLQKGELISLVGPSGVGKTTLLKIIAGLETATSGDIHYSFPPSKNSPIILVFQDYVLFPHMNVFDNIAFGLKMRKCPVPEIKEKTDRMLGYFGLSEKARHFPAQLSAGQKQRVAIARAMIVEPTMLLLDEPFANLDKNLKQETATFIRNTQQEFGITTLSVTHDLQEAFYMSDKIGVMLNRQLVQFDTVENVYHHPINPEVAEFMGPVNHIPGHIMGLISTSDIPQSIRPEALSITTDESGNGIIESVIFAGALYYYKVRIDDCSLTVHSLNNSLEVGNRVNIHIA